MKKLNVRYFDKVGKFIDHGRMIYKTTPKIGEIVHPFHRSNGVCNWKVVKVKNQDDKTDIDIHVEDVDQSIGGKISKIFKFVKSVLTNFTKLVRFHS